MKEIELSEHRVVDLLKQRATVAYGMNDLVIR
jgi:hypothetical protein